MWKIGAIVFAVAFCLVSAGLWVLASIRWRRGQRGVAYEPAATPCWGLLDLLTVLAILFALNLLAGSWISARFGAMEDWTVRQHCWQRGSLATASLATFLLGAAALQLRYRLAWSQLGLSLAAWRSDIRLGAIVFVLVAPPIYALQLLLVWLLRPQTRHPIVELLSAHPDACLIAISVVSAVLVAPLVEEFLFRGLLQGWLEKLVRVDGSPLTLLLGDVAATADAPQPLLSPPDAHVRYQPLLISSAVFSVLHMQHGTDWIPLFFLALVLGYLYQQTHRLLPGITVHFLLNACSMAILWLDLRVFRG